MSKIGYVYGTVGESILGWMNGYGLDSLYHEGKGHEKCRPKWKEAISRLGGGDELVIASFGNAVRSLGKLALLIELCRLRGIRLISVEDRIDTREELFGRIKVGVLLSIVSQLPEKVVSLRQSLGEEKLQHESGAVSMTKAARLRRDRKAISLYLAGHSLKVIMEKTGIKHTSLYNILKRNGIGRDRIERKKATS